jgi:hypothetical protein
MSTHTLACSPTDTNDRFALVASSITQAAPAGGSGGIARMSAMQQLSSSLMASTLSTAEAAELAPSAGSGAGSSSAAAAAVRGLQQHAAPHQQLLAQHQQPPDSVLLQLDHAVHAYVVAHTTPEFRLLADTVVSDAAITLGIAGWVACSATCLLQVRCAREGRVCHGARETAMRGQRAPACLPGACVACLP